MIGHLRLVLTILGAVLSLAVLLLPYLIARAVSGHGAVRVARLWHRAVLWMTGTRVIVHGEPSRARPLLLLSNHISWFDIIVLAGTLPVSFIAKQEVGTWPVFSWLARLQRSIFVDRERRHRTGATSDQVAGRMADGEIIVLFAEGTSSAGDRVLPFRSALVGAGQRAVDGERTAALQPVAIAYRSIQGLPIGRQDRARIAWFGGMDLLPHLGRLLRDGAIDVHLAFAPALELGRNGDRKAVTTEACRIVGGMVSDINRGREPRNLEQKKLN
jgi:1-acyl-sn-glycerol-3-phosphate acyltransferase